MKKNLEHSFLDHFLVMVACSSSLYALGESLSKHTLSLFLAIGAAISVLTGFLLSRALAGKKVREYDAYFWTALAIGTSLFSRPLNGLLPEEGFPFMLFAGTWLSWMVLLCGVVSWRDQTLLFLNLPCLSIFALVGTFDTFAPATILFFVFLVCSSLLYARIHQRSMLRRAQQAGYSDPELLERDAWRWVAGPEWAFASAGAIVVLSLVFGPLLRFTLQPVSGTVKVGLPQITSTTNALNSLDNTEVQVGKGQILPSNDTVFKIKMEGPDYLRTAIYTSYMGNGWARIQSNSLLSRLGAESKVLNSFGMWQSAWPEGPPLEPIDKPVTKQLTLKGPSVEVPSLPSPGPIQSIYSDVPGDTIFTPTGLVFRRGGLGVNEIARVRYLTPDPSTKPGRAAIPDRFERISQYYLSLGKTPRRVIDFARNAASGGENDYDRAMRVKRAIESMAGYTLKAPPVSPTSDAVEQFLFTTKKGYCDLFATAMVVCARANGLPARYTIGYLVQDPKPGPDGFYNVTGKEAHAWAEIYFENLGWVKFDATEGAPLIPDEIDQKDLPWYLRRWALYGMAAVIIAAIVGGLAWARSRDKQAGVVQQRHLREGALKMHREFDRAVRRKTGVTRRFSQTTAEYVSSVVPQLGASAATAQELVSKLEAACFGESELDKREIADLAQRLKEFGRMPGVEKP